MSSRERNRKSFDRDLGNPGMAYFGVENSN